MPGFDGTGFLGRGPMTGRGRGYCIVPLDRSNSARQPTVSAYDTLAQNLYPGAGFFRRGFFSGGGFRCRGGRRFKEFAGDAK